MAPDGRLRKPLLPLLLLVIARAAAGSGPGQEPEPEQQEPAQQRCSPQGYQTCVRMAGPLLTEPSLVFPDNMADVDKLCRRWRGFVQCVKEYTERCFSLAKQREFVRAVQSPVGLAYRLCTEPRYQTEYLRHAHCIHPSIADGGRCADLHQRLVGRVLGDVRQRQLCCAQRQFHGCVLGEVGRQCAGADSIGFARELLDKVFNYIETKCLEPEHAAADCGYDTAGGEAAPAPSNRSAGAEQLGQKQPDADHTEAQQQRSYGPGTALHTADGAVASPWTPGRGGAPPPPPPDAAPAPAGGDPQARDRPPAYGRGLAWTPAPGPAPTPDQPVGHSTWKVSSSPTEHWYPAGKLSNVLDEPNQQGLAGGGAFLAAGLRSLLLLALPLALALWP